MLKIVENLWAVGAPPRTPLGFTNWWGRGLLPSPNPTPLSAFGLSPNEISLARPCPQVKFTPFLLSICTTCGCRSDVRMSQNIGSSLSSRRSRMSNSLFTLSSSFVSACLQQSQIIFKRFTKYIGTAHK